jgi:beta-N-acetylhexosaminidase
MGADHAAVGAVRAGCDVLLLCCDDNNQALAEAGLAREAERDSDFAHRVAAAAARVRAMKLAHATKLATLPPLGRGVVGSFEHRKLADRLAGRA